MAAWPDIDSQRAYYDERWMRVTHANLWQAGRAIAVLDGLRRIGKDSPRMLDLGCGTGWLTAILAQFGPTTGVELSPLAINRAREQYPDIEFLSGDFFTVPLPRGTFDVVVSCQVMEHVDVPQRFVDLVAEVLKPDGHLLLVTDNWWNIARWGPGEFARFAGAPQPIQHRPSVREFKQLLRTRFTVQRFGRSSRPRPSRNSSRCPFLSLDQDARAGRAARHLPRGTPSLGVRHALVHPGKADPGNVTVS
jgi:SAM-dependent methyltransferase